MAQISFKIPENEMKFLKWFSSKTAQPISSIYRNATLNPFQEWKLSVLLDEYRKGAIGFKQLCNLGNITFQEGSLILEKNAIDPPISELMDDYMNKVSEQIKPKELFKEKSVPKRESSEVK